MGKGEEVLKVPFFLFFYDGCKLKQSLRLIVTVEITLDEDFDITHN